MRISTVVNLLTSFQNRLQQRVLLDRESHKEPLNGNEHFRRIPREIRLEISTKLSWAEVCNLSLVCKELKDVALQRFFAQHPEQMSRFIHAAIRSNKIEEIFRLISYGQITPISISLESRLHFSDFSRLLGVFSKLTSLQMDGVGTNFRPPKIFSFSSNIESIISVADQVFKTDLLAFSDDTLELILEKQKYLQQLSLGTVKNITDKAFEFTREYKALHTLDISHSKITTRGMKLIFEKFPELNSLSLASCHTSWSKESIIQRPLYNLLNLTLKDIPIHDVTLVSILHNTPNLHHIELSQCRNISSTGYQAIARCSQLKQLRLSDCTDEILQEIIKYCPSITHLTLNGCRKLTAKSLIKITSLRHLKSLEISMTQIDWDTLVNILNRCSFLQNFQATYCRNLFREKREYFAPRHIFLQTVDFKGSLDARERLIGQERMWPNCKEVLF